MGVCLFEPASRWVPRVADLRARAQSRSALQKLIFNVRQNCGSSDGLARFRQAFPRLPHLSGQFFRVYPCLDTGNQREEGMIDQDFIRLGRVARR